MATTDRSFTSDEIDLGLDDNSYPMKGVRQTQVDPNSVSPFFQATLDTAADLGADDVGLYFIEGGTDHQYLLVGWLGDQLIKSQPSPQISDEMAQEFIEAIREVHNQQRHNPSAL